MENGSRQEIVCRRNNDRWSTLTRYLLPEDLTINVGPDSHKKPLLRCTVKPVKYMCRLDSLTDILMLFQIGYAPANVSPMKRWRAETRSR